MTVRAETQIDLARVDDGSPGTPGQNGATFTPSVAVDGDISWTNDGGLPNPPTQNIMGPQGDPGTPGTNGVSVTSVEPQYYLSTSDTSTVGGSWSSTPATFVSGEYYWTRDYITYSDGSHSTSTEVYNTGMTQAAQDAYDAKTLADDTNQYFWYAPTGADTGAHITEIPQDEWNDSSDPNYHSGGNLLARSTGIAVRDGMTELATFGATGETIGITDGTQSYMSLDYHSIQGIDKEGNTYFYVSDLRDANGEYSAKDTFIGDGVTTVFSLSINVFSNLVVNVNNVEQTINVDYTYDSASWKITFMSPPANGSIIDITYTSQNSNSKAYTLGRRAAGSTIGGMSFAEGRLTTASGYASHAEGRETVSSGRFAHAEGIQSTAQNQSSHAEGAETIASGISAHAEGNVTTASGQSAHAEGLRSVASGDESHAQNWRTKASSFAQTAIGQCNIEDTTNTYALIIGNGTADNARSDALRVLWNGNVYMALNTNAGSGIDHDLYAAITALGWQSNVIV